jgi:hypothetical protein
MTRKARIRAGNRKRQAAKRQRKSNGVACAEIKFNRKLVHKALMRAGMTEDETEQRHLVNMRLSQLIEQWAQHLIENF